MEAINKYVNPTFELEAMIKNAKENNYNLFIFTLENIITIVETLAYIDQRKEELKLEVDNILMRDRATEIMRTNLNLPIAMLFDPKSDPSYSINEIRKEILRLDKIKYDFDLISILICN